MRLSRALSLVASLGLAACGGGGVDFFDDGGPSAPQTFLQTAAAGNIVGDHTLISHPDLDGNPAAMLLVTPVYNPGGVGGTYVHSTIGVEYVDASGRWSVYREDGAAMEPGAAFAVSILPGIATNFVHRATAGNVSFNTTYIDHPATNGNRPALLLVTHAFAAGGVGGMRETRPVGVWFDTTRPPAGQWGIFHEDGADMEVGQAFFVSVLPTTDRSYLHVSTAGDTLAQRTIVSNPYFDGQPNALFHATHVYNPPGVAHHYDFSPIGVYWTGGGGHWAVFNETTTLDMEVGTAFSVWIPVP